jgi:hypothetical protein
MDYKSTLLNLIGLPENADDSALANSINSFQAELCQYKEMTDGQLVSLETNLRNSTSENEALTAANEKLTNSNKSMLEVLVNSDLQTYADRISDVEAVKTMLMNNREVGLAFLKGIKITNAAPAPVVDPKPTRKAPLHNSSKAAQPEPILNANQGETEEFSVKVSNRAREIQSTNKGMGWNQAFLNARAELVAGQQIVN